MYLHEQIAYKAVWPAQKKWRPELIIVKMAIYQRLRLLLCFGHRLLTIISKVFFFKKRTLKQLDTYGCYGAIFAFREFKLTMRSRPQRV